MYDVFISYARAGSTTQAKNLAQALISKDFSVFLDTREIPLGGTFPKDIADSLLKSKVMVIFAEPTYFERYWCVCEYQIGISLYRKVANGSTKEIEDIMKHIVIALPGKEDIEKITPHLPPPLAQKSWPQRDDLDNLVALTQERISSVSATFGKHLQEFDDDAVKMLLEGGAIPIVSPIKKVPNYLKNLPDSLGKNFVGREDILWKIFHSLETNAVSGNAASCMLYGTGGTGKTQVAAEYVWRYGMTYYPGGIFWINADCDENELVDQFYEILKLYDSQIEPLHELGSSEGERRRILSDKLLDVFSATNNEDIAVLWVIDNIPEPAKGRKIQPIKYWCPITQYARILGTTRRSILNVGLQIKIEELLPDAAVEILTAKAVNRSSLKPEEWIEIVKWVGCLPLALQILHTLLSAKFISPKTLLERTQEKEPASFLNEEFESLREEVEDTYLRGVTETFHLSYSLLAQDVEACNALHFLAFLSFVPIPEPLLAKAFPATILGKLANRSWIQSSEGGAHVRHWGMHRIVSSYIRSLTKHPARILGEIADWVSTAVESDLEWDVVKKCSPHLIRLLNTARVFLKEDNEQTYETLVKIAHCGLSLSTYKMSEDYPDGIRYLGARLVYWTRYDEALVKKLIAEYEKNLPHVSKHIPHVLQVFSDNEGAAHLFVRLLKDESKDVRWKALIYAHLSKRADILALPLLHTITDEQNENVRLNAIIGYEHLFTADSPDLNDVILHLIHLIDTGNTLQAEVAAKIAGRLFKEFGEKIRTNQFTSSIFAKELINRLLTIPEESVAIELADGLAQFENNDVYDRMIELLSDALDKTAQIRAIKVVDTYLRVMTYPPAPKGSVEYTEEGDIILKPLDGTWFPSKKQHPELNKPLGKFVLEDANPDIFDQALEVLCKSDVGKYGLMEAVYDLIDAGEHLRVIEVAGKVMELSPGFASPYMWRSQAYEKLGKLDKAISDQSVLISMTSDLDASYRSAYIAQRANLYEKQNKLEAAIDDYTLAIEVESGNANLHQYRGYLYNKIGNTANALRDFEKAVQLNQQDTYSLREKAILHKKIGEYEHAIETIDKLLSIEKSDVEAMYVKAVCQLNLGLPSNAIESISGALLLEKDHPEYLYIRGLARYRAGLIDDALKDAQRCIELKPDHAKCSDLLDLLDSNS